MYFQRNELEFTTENGKVDLSVGDTQAKGRGPTSSLFLIFPAWLSFIEFPSCKFNQDEWVLIF